MRKAGIGTPSAGEYRHLEPGAEELFVLLGLEVCAFPLDRLQGLVQKDSVVGDLCDVAIDELAEFVGTDQLLNRLKILPVMREARAPRLGGPGLLAERALFRGGPFLEASPQPLVQMGELKYR